MIFIDAAFPESYAPPGGCTNYASIENPKPGDLVQLFVTGLFRTTADVLPTLQSFSRVTLTTGSVSVTADSATLAAVGEFQINFRVPQQFANLPAPYSASG